MAALPRLHPGWWCGPLLLVGAAACERHAPKAKPPTAVRIETVAPTTQASTAHYSGSILAQTQVDLAFKVGGYVQAIAGPHDKLDSKSEGKHPKGHHPAGAAKDAAGRHLQAGDPVTAGTILAQLRKADFQQKLAELSAMNAEASAGLRKAKADFDRAQQLKDQNVISQADYDAARSRYEALGGSVSASGARAGQAALALSDSQLRSPLDGIVLDRRIEVGQLVPPGVAVFTIADTTTMKVVFGVPDTVQRTLAQGDPVVITTDAVTDRNFNATVTKIAASADPKTRIFDIEASLDNSDGVLKVGMVASIKIGRHNEGALTLVPLSAVIRTPGDTKGFAVFIVTDSDTRAKVAPVELGHLVGNRVSVSKGLAAGDHVVVQGSTLLRDGDLVSVIPGVVSAPAALNTSVAGEPAGSPK